MTERITQIANNGMLHFAELTLAVSESGIDGILIVACTAISAVASSLKVICLGQRSGAWI